MPEVKRYQFKGAAGEYVYANDFDRVTAERDGLQALLTAADERAEHNARVSAIAVEDVLLLKKRADVLETALKKISARCVAYIEAEREMPEPSVEVCQMIASAALKPAEGRNEPNCLRCLDKKTVPSNLAEGYVMDCPDCCSEEG
ncbi:hypothetical protein JFT33_06120 [Pseudomonas carnis]|uniref:hypothetical protein n=1 Tax=Pseudomonas carnis TaxID=2487355 RepID=UPI0018E8C40A|nr:hypothetical protein [Pseudomonas carnis]MBJ2206159.1 hypothetical protein [Pseudomonas carnis]